MPKARLRGGMGTDVALFLEASVTLLHASFALCSIFLSLDCAALMNWKVVTPVVLKIASDSLFLCMAGVWTHSNCDQFTYPP